jgi:hypothetical protein
MKNDFDDRTVEELLKDENYRKEMLYEMQRAAAIAKAKQQVLDKHLKKSYN